MMKAAVRPYVMDLGEWDHCRTTVATAILLGAQKLQLSCSCSACPPTPLHCLVARAPQLLCITTRGRCGIYSALPPPCVLLPRPTLPCFVPAGSTNGTFLNRDRLDPERYYELLEKVRWGRVDATPGQGGHTAQSSGVLAACEGDGFGGFKGRLACFQCEILTLALVLKH